MTLLSLLVLPIYAQDPAPPPTEEIVVWGDLAIAKARDGITRQMEDLGYRVARKQDGRIVFRGPNKVTLLPSGALLFAASGPRLVETPPEGYSRDPRYQSIDPGPMSGGGLSVAMPGGRKVDAQQTKVLDETRDEIEAYISVVRRTEFENMLAQLPDRLDRLWSDGTPIDPNKPALATPAERRRVALELWATRTETPEGQRAAAAIEAWLSAVVQSSPDPITDAERSEFNARRTDGRTLP